MGKEGGSKGKKAIHQPNADSEIFALHMVTGHWQAMLTIF